MNFYPVSSVQFESPLNLTNNILAGRGRHRVRARQGAEPPGRRGRGLCGREAVEADPERGQEAAAGD